MNKNGHVTVRMLAAVGTFAENKDLAKQLRSEIVLPALREGGNVVLDFTGVESTTQSFVHALISQIIRDRGIEILDRILFKGCNDGVMKFIVIVTEYMQYEEEPTEPPPNA